MEQMQDSIRIHELLHLSGIVGEDNKGQTNGLGNGQVITGSAGVTAVRDALHSSLRTSPHGRYRFGFSLIYLVLVNFALVAQPRVSFVGIVTDETKHAIPGVHIQVLDGSETRTRKVLMTVDSGMNGSFEIDGVLCTDCYFRLTASGFAARTVKISRHRRQATIDLGKIELKLSCTGPGVYCDDYLTRH